MARAKKQSDQSDAPSGFRKVETTLSGFWKPEGEGESIQGIVGPAIEVIGKDGKENNFYPLTLTTANGSSVISQDGKPVKIEKGLKIGIGGKMLLSFLADQVGKEVFLVYRGLGKAKPRQSPPKLYDMYERSDEE